MNESRKFNNSTIHTFDEFEQIAERLNIDLPELLSRKVVDTTVNEIVFNHKKIAGDNDNNVLWEQFISDLKEYNNLEKIHKTDVKYKSKYGKSIVGFDFWNNKPVIWFADNDGQGEAIRINGQEQFVIHCTRTYATINNGTPILKNKLTITKKNINYLFAGGFGVNSNNKSQILKINNSKDKLQKLKDSYFPFKWCNIKTPEYIISQFKTGTFNHDYKVLPASEMLNKDFVDDDAFKLDPSYNSKDIYFSDWYQASDLINLFNGFLQFYATELCLDHTRLIGTFSQQDINNLINGNKQTRETTIKSLLSRMGNLRDSDLSVEQSAIKQKLIVRSMGGEGSQLDKMQTTLRSEEFTATLDLLIGLFFKASGYNWNVDNSSGNYENVSQTLNQNRGVYESTKEKITLFTRQWKQFYSKIAYVWFAKHNQPFINLQQAEEEFEKYVDFQIVSNVLQKENVDYQKIVELKQNGLISTFSSLKHLFPEMTDKEIVEEIARIEAENNKDNNYDNNFNNQDFSGYQENKNHMIDNDGVSQEGEDYE